MIPKSSLLPAVALLLVLLFAGGSLGAQERFDNYRVYSVNIENEAQRGALDGLWRVLSKSVNYWKGGNQVDTIADLMVAPEDQPQFEAILEQNEFKWQLKVNNVQELIDGQQPKVKPRLDDGAMEWESYHTFDEITAWMDGLLVTYPDILTDVSIGFSVEGRPLRGLKLSRQQGNKAILIEANTHAREWITAATATYFLNELLTSTDANMIDLSTAYDWIVFPVHNPDGYVYSFETNRMWRKNRGRHGLICIGVDPNRNWGYQWKSKLTSFRSFI